MKPSQRKSTTEKLSDKEWQKQTAKYFIGIASNLIDSSEYDLLISAATGNLREEQYYHIIPSLTEGSGNFASYPSKIRNFPIIPRALVALMGEKIERPIIAIVAALNSNFTNKQREYEYNEIIKSVSQQYMIELKNQGIDIETMKDANGNDIPPKSIEQIKLEASNLTDEMAVMGQDFIDMANSLYDIPIKFRDGFLSFLSFGKVTSYKDVKHDELEYKIIPINGISYVANKGTKFLEDAECVINTFGMSLTDLSELFDGDEEYENTVKPALENKFSGLNGNNGVYAPNQAGHWFNLGNTDNNINSNSGQNVTVQHITFVSEVKIGKLTTITGEVIEVNDEYEPTIFDQIEWKWVNERWEGYIIDETYYVGFQPLPLQRGKFNNPYAGKLPYNGRIYGSTEMAFQSVVKQLIPYQIIHNIIKFHIELLINKNKDKFVAVPLSLLPDNKETGMTPILALQNAVGTGWFLYDDSNANSLQAVNGLKAIDASLGDILNQLSEYDKRVVAEADELIGLTPQRLGQGITSSSGLGTTKEAIYRGSVLTEELFKEYDEFQTSEYQGMLDLSPYCFSEGRTVSYFSSDFKVKYREFYGFDMQQVQFAVKVKDGKRELNNLETMRQTAFSMAQNGQMASMVGSILESNNFVSLMKDIKEMEDKMQQRAESAAQREEAMKAEELNLQANMHQDDLDLKYYEIDMKNLTERLNKVNEEHSSLVTSTPDTKDNSIAITQLEIERQKIQTDILKHQSLLREKELERKSKEKMNTEKLKSAEKVAKSNKNRYDK